MASQENVPELELRAKLLFEEQNRLARELAKAQEGRPAGMVEMDPDEVVAAWQFTTEAEPERVLYERIDQLVLQGVPPEEAEVQALEAVYPHRAALCGLGVRPRTEAVAEAERIARLVARHTEDRP